MPTKTDPPFASDLSERKRESHIPVALVDADRKIREIIIAVDSILPASAGIEQRPSEDWEIETGGRR